MGSSRYVLFYDAFSRMNLSCDYLQWTNSPLVGFSRDAILVEGIIDLLMTVGQESKQATIMLNFLVVKVLSVYNIILGRLDLNALHAIISTYHLLMKFPTTRGVGEV